MPVDDDGVYLVEYDLDTQIVSLPLNYWSSLCIYFYNVELAASNLDVYIPRLPDIYNRVEYNAQSDKVYMSYSTWRLITIYAVEVETIAQSLE